MKIITQFLTQLGQSDIAAFEKHGEISFDHEGQTISIQISEVEIISEDIPGWLVEHDGNLIVALDTKISDELKSEGLARELINKIQNIRKDSDFEVTDKITVLIKSENVLKQAIKTHYSYISSQILADEIKFVDNLEQNDSNFVKINDEIETIISINKN